MRGYKESGTTTTPFDMVVRNDLDRSRLVMDVIDRVPAHAPLADGTTIRIRPVVPADPDRLERFYDDTSPDNLRLRFFGVSRRSAAMTADRACVPPRPGYRALVDAYLAAHPDGGWTDPGSAPTCSAATASRRSAGAGPGPRTRPYAPRNGCGVPTAGS